MTEFTIKRSSRAAQQGFSLLEALIVVAIICILAATTLLGMRSLLGNYKADGAANVVTSQLRAARTLAITRRHYVKVWFDTTIAAPDYAPHVLYQMQSSVLGEAVPAAVSAPLPPYTTFMLETGVGDTPMGFGNAGAIYVGGVTNGPPIMQFSTSGAFVSSATSPINGTLFIGMANNPASARAVTILGSTGRIRTYYYSGVTTTTPTGWRE